MMLFKPLFKKGITVVDTGKRNLGHVPVRVAKELVDNKLAIIVHSNPTLIALQHTGKTRTEQNHCAISSNPLKNIVSIASLFCTKSGRIDVLNSVMFKIANDRLFVSSTNLDSYFAGSITSGSKYTFTHDKGITEICVNVQQLKKILTCPDECSSIQLISGETPSLKVGSFVIEGFCPDEKFPDMQKQRSGDKIYPFTITDVGKKLAFASKAVSNSKYKASLSGILFDIARQQLVGADGNRLHVVAMNESGKTRSDKHTVENVIVPVSVLKVARLLTGDGQIIVENDADRHVSLALNVPGCGDCRAVYRAIDGIYPKYDDVIPKGFASRFTTRTQDMLPVLHKTLIANTASDSKPVFVEFKHGQMIVTVKTSGRIAYQGVVYGQYSGTPYRGVVNVIFILDATQIRGDSVEILLQSESDKAWTIRNGSGYNAVVMPIELESLKH